MGDHIGVEKAGAGERVLAIVAWVLALVPGFYGLAIVFDAPGRDGWGTADKIVGVAIGLLGIAAATFLVRGGMAAWRGEPRGGRRVGIWIGLGFLWVVIPGFMYAASGW